MTAAAPAGAGAARTDDVRFAGRALLLGHFAIGCGVMVVPGSLNDIVRSLQVSVPVGGQLVSVAAIEMCVSAPAFAAAAGGWDRRRLLAFALLWYAAGHALCALVPGFAALLAVRAATVLAAAVFTPQAAAAIGVMAAPAQRGRAITFIFLGWSVASVVGTPVHAYIGEAFGWRWAFALVALIAAAAAWAVWRAMPDGVKPAALSLASWRSIFTAPSLIAIPPVTMLAGAGQFTLFSCFAPYCRHVLHADALVVSVLFMWFGAFGVAGNLIASRATDRLGAPRTVALTLAAMLASLLALPLGAGVVSMAIVLVPWALGCFSANSAQQARASLAAPALAEVARG